MEKEVMLPSLFRDKGIVFSPAAFFSKCKDSIESYEYKFIRV